MSTAKELSEKLFYRKKSVYAAAGEEVVQGAYEYAKGYAQYLDAAKTEREAVAESIRLAEAKGFSAYKMGDPMVKGGKYYYNNRDKNLFLFTIGSDPVENGIRICAAHIDSPRIDLKQCPLYEDGGMSFFKTHYYGGILKYQWMATPLALHGVIVKRTVLVLTSQWARMIPILYFISTICCLTLVTTRPESPWARQFPARS